MEERSDVSVINDEVVYCGFKFKNKEDLLLFKTNANIAAETFIARVRGRKGLVDGYVFSFIDCLRLTCQGTNGEYEIDSPEMNEKMGSFLEYFGDPAFLSGPLKFETKKVYDKLCKEFIGMGLIEDAIVGIISPLVSDDHLTVKETYGKVLAEKRLMSDLDNAFEVKPSE